MCAHYATSRNKFTVGFQCQPNSGRLSYVLCNARKVCALTKVSTVLKGLKTSNVQIFPAFNLICLCRIKNRFCCWIMNAFNSEKRCPTLMDFWHHADWHHGCRCFKGARSHHVRVESSCFRREFWSFVHPRSSWRFDQWQVTSFPPIRKRIWVRR